MPIGQSVTVTPTKKLSKIVSFFNAGPTGAVGDFSNQDFSPLDFSTGSAISSMTLSITALHAGKSYARQLSLFSSEIVQTSLTLPIKRLISTQSSEFLQIIKSRQRLVSIPEASTLTLQFLKSLGSTWPKLISFINAGGGAGSSGDFSSQDFSSLDFATGTTAIPSMVVSIIPAKISRVPYPQQLLIRSSEVVQTSLTLPIKRLISIQSSEFLQIVRGFAKGRLVSIIDSSKLTVQAIKSLGAAYPKLISFINAGGGAGSGGDFSSQDFSSLDFATGTAVIPSMAVSLASAKVAVRSVVSTALSAQSFLLSKVIPAKKLNALVTSTQITGANLVVRNITGKLLSKSTEVVTSRRSNAKTLLVNISTVLATFRVIVSRRILSISINELVTERATQTRVRTFFTPEIITRRVSASKTSLFVLSSEVVSDIKRTSRLSSFVVPVSVLIYALRSSNKSFLFQVGEIVSKVVSPVRSVIVSTSEIITKRVSLSKIVNLSNSSFISLKRSLFYHISLSQGQTVRFYKTLTSKVTFAVPSIITYAATPPFRRTILFVTNNLLNTQSYIALRSFQFFKTGTLVTAFTAKGLTALPLAVTIFSSQVIRRNSAVLRSLFIFNPENLKFTKSLAIVRTIPNYIFLTGSNLVTKSAVDNVNFQSSEAFSVVKSSVKSVVLSGLSELVKVAHGIPNRLNILSPQHSFIAFGRRLPITFSVPLLATTGKITNKIILLYQSITQPKHLDVVLSYFSHEVVTAKTAAFKFLGQIIVSTSSGLLFIPFLQRGRIFQIFSGQSTSINRVGYFLRTLVFGTAESIAVTRASSSSINVPIRESIFYTKAINRLTQLSSSISILFSVHKLVRLSQVLLQSSEVLSFTKTYSTSAFRVVTSQVLVLGKSVFRIILIPVNQIISTGKGVATLIVDFTSEVLSTTTSVQFTSFQNLVSTGQSLSLIRRTPAAQFRFLINHLQTVKSSERATKLIQIVSVNTVILTKRIFKAFFFFSIAVVASAIKGSNKSFGIIANQVVRLTRSFSRLFSIQLVEKFTLIKSSSKVAFSYVVNETVTLTNLINKYILLVSGYGLGFTKAVNKSFVFVTYLVTSFSRIGSKYFVFIQNSHITTFRPVYKVFNFLVAETVSLKIRTSHIISVVSGQLTSLVVISSKIFKVLTHELLQFSRSSKGRIFVGIDQITDMVKSVNWHMLVHSPEKFTLSRITTKIVGFQERVTSRLNFAAGRVSIIVSTVRSTLAKATNKISRIGLIEAVSLIRVPHKIIRITSPETVRKIIGRSIAFVQSTSLILRRTTLKTTRVVSNIRLIYTSSVRKTLPIIVRSSQLIAITRMTLKHIKIITSQKLREVRTFFFTIRIRSSQLITKKFGFHETILVHWFETLLVRKTTLKSVKLKIVSHLTVPRTTLKSIRFAIRSKLQFGIIFHQVVSYMTPVVSTIRTKYGKIPIIVQGSVVSVITKMRTLIQRAVILLTGA